MSTYLGMSEAVSLGIHSMLLLAQNQIEGLNSCVNGSFTQCIRSAPGKSAAASAKKWHDISFTWSGGRLQASSSFCRCFSAANLRGNRRAIQI